MDYFQNDLFPPSLTTWEASGSASEWFNNANLPRKFVTLKPNDMEPRTIFSLVFFFIFTQSVVSVYKDMYIMDLARSVPIPGTPDSAVSNGNVSAMEPKVHSNGVTENGKRHESEADKVDSSVVSETFQTANDTFDSPHSTKLIEDGLAPFAEPEPQSPTFRSDVKANSQQPKRLSIDPNCGTPLRDLLRRCDEIPNAMRRKSDNIDDGTGDDENDAKDWE